MSMFLSVLGRGRWMALVLGILFLFETDIFAQQLRGPAAAGGVPFLPPKPPINLLNNGSLATWPNPNAILPNQLQFAYIAALPLGDRLGYNGIGYDPELIPNIGAFPGPGGMGAMPGPGPFPGPFPGPIPVPIPIPIPVKAAQMARQRMIAMQMQQMQMMAMQAQYYQYQQGAMMQSYGAPAAGAEQPNQAAAQTYQTGLTTNGSRSAATAAPLYNQGFGSGFRN